MISRIFATSASVSASDFLFKSMLASAKIFKAVGLSDSEDIGERNFHPLIAWEVHSRDTSHVATCLSNTSLRIRTKACA